MFERFTERARKVVVLAQEEAVRFGHSYIGTEHLLLGLIREDEGVAARALGSLNVTLSKVREQVESIVGYGEEKMGGQAPFTPRSKRHLEFALREALRLGHNYIGTEHILLGLVSENEGNAARVLSNLGVNPDKVRREVVRVLSGGQEAVAGSIDRSADTRSTVFRARVEGLVVEAHCGVTDEERAQLQSLRVDLDYSYGAGEGDDLSGTVDYGAIIEDIAGLVEREEFRLLETGARMVGEHVLDRFQAVWKVNVTVTKLRVPVARAVSGVSVEATFRR